MRRVFFALLLPLMLFAAVTPAQEKQLTVEDIFNDEVFEYPELTNAQWTRGGNTLLWLETGDDGWKSIMQYDIPSREKSVFLDFQSLDIPVQVKKDSLKAFEISSDGKLLLLSSATPARSIKTAGPFFVYDLGAGSVILSVQRGRQINIHFSPDASHVSFVRNNDLFVVEVQSGRETQLTTDGNYKIINGAFDWVYEEEFSVIKGYEWSPDSKKLAYWRFDQSRVPLISLARYDSLYLNPLTYHYPKAGSPVSEVRIGIADVASGQTVFADLGSGDDFYIPRMAFTPDSDRLIIQRLNRLQNTLTFLITDPSTGRTGTAYKETDRCWVNVRKNFFPLERRDQFIKTTEASGFNHIYMINYSGTDIIPVTSGTWEVNEILGIDESAQKIYFTSNERGLRYNDLYVINFDGDDKERITSTAGEHEIILSPNFLYYLDKYSSTTQMPAYSIHSISGSMEAALTSPSMEFYDIYDFADVEFLEFETSDLETLPAAIIKPPDFDEDEQYPVLIYNYSGPRSQVVTESWGGASFLWYQLLAREGYIVFYIDGRGTGGRGKEFKNQLYKHLGRWEVSDLEEAAIYLKSLPYVDGERIGVWGWSYGGYIAALTLANAAEHFKAAVSVAPVTDWRYYDAIYTERYMSLPSRNPEGYEQSSVLTNAHKIRGRLFLAHGTLDDNVHFQNSVKLAQKLQELGTPFEAMYYPEKNHGLRPGTHARQHLYELMTEFILRSL